MRIFIEGDYANFLVAFQYLWHNTIIDDVFCYCFNFVIRISKVTRDTYNLKGMTSKILLRYCKKLMLKFSFGYSIL